jgi:hypothetical protein
MLYDEIIAFILFISCLICKFCESAVPRDALKNHLYKHRDRIREPVPHKRKVATVREFYTAFHDTKTLPLQTCVVCYRKYSMAELNELKITETKLADLRSRYGSLFACRRCFSPGKMALGCADCTKGLERKSLLTAAHVHRWLRCEHAYPEELKDLSPVEEKLIALNSCYGFITK